MKMMIRIRFVISLASLLVCFLFSGVSVFADQSIDLNDMLVQEETTLSEEDQKTYANGKITMAQIKEFFNSYVTQGVGQLGNCSKEELDYIAEQNSAQTDMFENFAKIVGEEPCGDYENFDDIEVKEQEDGTVDAVTTLHYSKKDLTMTMHITIFDMLGPVPTSVEFGLPDSSNGSIGEKMASAGVHTLLGMGTVFAVLIFISVLISCFKFIPKLIEAKENRKKNEPDKIVPENADTGIADSEAESPTDDLELVAVIASAIAASENTSTDSFVVRSIRRR